MIRSTVPADTPTLLRLAEDTGVFKPHEIQALQEVLDDYHSGNAELGHKSVTAEEDGRIVGFAYSAPAAMTVTRSRASKRVLAVTEVGDPVSSSGNTMAPKTSNKSTPHSAPSAPAIAVCNTRNLPPRPRPSASSRASWGMSRTIAARVSPNGSEESSSRLIIFSKKLPSQP